MKTYIGSLHIDDEDDYINEENQFSWKKLFALKKNKKGDVFAHKTSVVQVMKKIFGVSKNEHMMHYSRRNK